MMKGHSKEVVSNNIKEMVKAGHKPKQAIAAALASARKYKKMADGGQAAPNDGQNTTQTSAPGSGTDNSNGVYNPNSDDSEQSAKNSIAHGFGMAAGGLIDDDMDEGLDSVNDEQASRSLNENRIMGEYHPNQVANPETQNAERMLAQALYKKSEEEEIEGYAMGGLVTDGPEGDEPVGTQPSEDMDGPTEEPMSAEPSKPDGLEHAKMDDPMGMGLSEEAKKALADKKKGRRFVR